MQSTFHIKSGSMDIISSGTVIQFDKKPIEIKFNGLLFIFDFIDEEDDKKARAHT
jgi:hypothetical protein